jgi:hypothetical protein
MGRSSRARCDSFYRGDRHVTSRPSASMTSGHNVSDPPFGAHQPSLHRASPCFHLNRGGSLARADPWLVNSHPHIGVAPRIYSADARADIQVKGWIAPPGVE